MATVVITGGTGLIGEALSLLLITRGYKVIILTRQQSITSDRSLTIEHAHWNIKSGEIDKDAVAGADYIIHLAGASIAEKRWTAKRKKEILESRTKSSKLLIKALEEIPNHVKAIVSASAIGWYSGSLSEPFPKEDAFREDAPAANDFLGQTCKQWEQSIQHVELLNKRLVILRTAIVLSNEGGAFPEFKKPLKFGIASILGSGDQIISWVHITDLCRMYLFALENDITGIFNAVAPQPVSNKILMLTLAKKIKGNFFIPLHIPSFVLKIMLGEMSVEVLKSANVSSEKTRSVGFKFLYPSIDAAIKNLITE